MYLCTVLVSHERKRYGELESLHSNKWNKNASLEHDWWTRWQMELWTSWIQRRLEELQGRGNIATNNLILTALKSAIRTNGDLLLPRFDNQKTRGLVRRCCCCCGLMIWSKIVLDHNTQGYGQIVQSRIDWFSPGDHFKLDYKICNDGS